MSDTDDFITATICAELLLVPPDCVRARVRAGRTDVNDVSALHHQQSDDRSAAGVQLHFHFGYFSSDACVNQLILS